MIFNIGIVDVDYHVVKTPFYERWRDMLKRCYCEKYIQKTPTYLGCSVCEEWKYLSNFERWMKVQDWEGNVLDKDILYPGNKIYSPETCIFIPPGLNSFLTNSSSKNTSGFNGVRVRKSGKSPNYTAQISRGGRQYLIGTYSSKEEAYYYYKVERNKEIMKWIEKIDNTIIKEALKKHLHSLDDDTANFKGPIKKGTCHAKKCYIDGSVYKSAAEYAKIIGIDKSTVYKRIRNKNFPNYYYI